jgi:hypothetical protein
LLEQPKARLLMILFWCRCERRRKSHGRRCHVPNGYVFPLLTASQPLIPLAVVMIAYTIVLLTFVIRYRADRPLPPNSQIHLFRWWPNALRPKSKNKPSPASGMMVGRAYTGSEEMLNGAAAGVGQPKTSTPERVESQVTEGEYPEKGARSTHVIGDGEDVVYTEREKRGARILLWACAASTLLIFIR